MDKKQGIVIKKYVRPFVQLILENGQTENVFDQLSQMQSVFEETGLAHFLSNIAVGKLDKIQALRLFKQSETGLVENLIELLIQNDRENLLVDIVNESICQLEKETNCFQVELRSVTGLSTQQKERLTSIVEKKLGLSVRSFKEINDPSLIGGFIISANHKTIDASVKGQLQTMKEKLK
ncbi:ATP synthase delta chain [Streptococcus sp. DD10]|uniref:F0F1 ATP synthase subunit delta n=1 Tax=Streptococcus sp. DD10 TaxID=1777878 RepID=UPI000797F03A|nr:F0F1 ATP synthase subunit delta [Streptococcus sp. DD10]KXT76366.1 ATP synthase delta chain [Streptococcus sp. DD10]